MTLDAVLDTLARDDDAPLDLANVCLLIAKDEYPDLDVKSYKRRIKELADEWVYFFADHAEKGMTLAERLCRFLFVEKGFRGNDGDYDDPRNSYLNDVLDRRLGIPISLSVLAMIVGRRLGLRIQGVGLPGHFIAKDELDDIYFDPYHGGRILTPADCAELVLETTGVPFEASAENLAAAPMQLIVLRMLTNLKVIYYKTKDYRRGLRVSRRILQLRPDEASFHRDVGMGYIHVGQPGKAIDYLEHYLSCHPPEEEKDAVLPWLKRAKAEVARWN